MASKLYWDVCIFCSTKASQMGVIVCAADDIKLRDNIFRVTQFRVPPLPASLSPVCVGCRSQIVQCDADNHVPQTPSTTSADSKYPTVLLNVDPNDPLAVPEEVKTLYRSSYVPAEEFRSNFANDPMKIFRHMCDLCGSVVPSMEKHMAQHQVGNTFRCMFCNLSFKNKSLLECHISGHNKRLFVCHFCGQAYRTMTLLKLHMTRWCYKSTNQGKRRSKVYSCTLCGESFFSDYKRLKHQVQHNKRRLYECSVCRLIFPSMPFLRRHRRIHAADTGKLNSVKASNDEPDRIDIDQQQVILPEPVLPTNNALICSVKQTIDNRLHHQTPREKPLNMMESDPIAGIATQDEVTNPSESKENKSVNESSTIDTLKPNIPRFTEIRKVSKPGTRIKILEIIDLPRLPQQPTESTIKSKAVIPSSPKPKRTANACEDSICQPKPINLEILPSWKCHDKINSELWPILGVPSSLPLALKRKTVRKAITKDKEKRLIEQEFADRLVQLPRCLLKDCNCDDLIRCLYTQ
ncbi:zinc finger protein 236-like [Anopheles darlingi]|uniref:zinc finger protein 236-like n=1 Tax=Anopheles darlingi TaxID=43151 RepID=UPI00210009AC|nr:zinc finger protein 236-like [Anopheles darlingi]